MLKCSNIPNIYIYIYIYIYYSRTQKETFWSRGITGMGVLANFEPKIYKEFWTYQVFMCLIVINILSQNISKLDRKISNLSNLYVLNYFKISDKKKN